MLLNTIHIQSGNNENTKILSTNFTEYPITYLEQRMVNIPETGSLVIIWTIYSIEKVNKISVKSEHFLCEFAMFVY